VERMNRILNKDTKTPPYYKCWTLAKQFNTSPQLYLWLKYIY
jgi:hypothetical protein